MMKIIQSEKLDKLRWDKLVSDFDADVFSNSWYLDACADKWCVLVDDNFENGIALPYTIKLGIPTIAPPIFIRNLDFIGSDTTFPSKAMEIIEKHFRVGQMQLSFSLINRESNQSNRTFQTISAEKPVNQQSKRMIQKAVKNQIVVNQTNDWKSIFSIIESQLTEKISEFNEKNLNRLKTLLAALEKENKIHCLGIYQNEKLQGGMIFMESLHKRIYLKGASLPEAKNLGAMYLCMNSSIEETIADNRTFDFGGSGIEGVRRFNLNLGGTDEIYFKYTWNHAPWWFNSMRAIYQKFKKN